MLRGASNTVRAGTWRRGMINAETMLATNLVSHVFSAAYLTTPKTTDDLTTQLISVVDRSTFDT